MFQLVVCIVLSALVAIPSTVSLHASHVVPQAPQGGVGYVEPATSSKVWLGRHAEFEEFLRTATIERFENTQIGVTAPRRCFFTPGGLAASGLCKNLQPGVADGFFESYKSEIAAYKLDRLLQLDMVPPTVERTISRGPQSIQLWVENVIMQKDMEENKLQPNPPDIPEFNRQFYRFRVFDNLIGNIDSNKGNMLFDRLWNHIKVDHSRAFTDTMTMPWALVRIDRVFFDRLKALDRRTVTREIGHLLEAGAMNALFLRRDEIVQTFERLVKEQGEREVFVP
jgi:hypothetical protein